MSPIVASVLTAAVFVVAIVIVRWFARRAASRRAVGRARRAVAGEMTGVELLADAGYEVLETQVTRSWTFHCDGAPVTVELRCDALVAREGRRMVAEVKTGEKAPSLTTAATRRQLLEYAVAFRADGVVLVDAEAGEVREVEFDL